jgi:hypothetical protein
MSKSSILNELFNLINGKLRSIPQASATSQIAHQYTVQMAPSLDYINKRMDNTYPLIFTTDHCLPVATATTAATNVKKNNNDDNNIVADITQSFTTSRRVMPNAPVRAGFDDGSGLFLSFGSTEEGHGFGSAPMHGKPAEELLKHMTRHAAYVFASAKVDQDQDTVAIPIEHTIVFDGETPVAKCATREKRAQQSRNIGELDWPDSKLLVEYGKPLPPWEYIRANRNGSQSLAKKQCIDMLVKHYKVPHGCKLIIINSGYEAFQKNEALVLIGTETGENIITSRHHDVAYEAEVGIFGLVKKKFESDMSLHIAGLKQKNAFRPTYIIFSADTDVLHISLLHADLIAKMNLYLVRSLTKNKSQEKFEITNPFALRNRQRVPSSNATLISSVSVKRKISGNCVDQRVTSTKEIVDDLDSIESSHNEDGGAGVDANNDDTLQEDVVDHSLSQPNKKRSSDMFVLSATETQKLNRTNTKSSEVMLLGSSAYSVQVIDFNRFFVGCLSLLSVAHSDAWITEKLPNIYTPAITTKYALPPKITESSSQTVAEYVSNSLRNIGIILIIRNDYNLGFHGVPRILEVYCKYYDRITDNIISTCKDERTTTTTTTTTTNVGDWNCRNKHKFNTNVFEIIVYSAYAETYDVTKNTTRTNFMVIDNSSLDAIIKRKRKDARCYLPSKVALENFEKRVFWNFLYYQDAALESDKMANCLDMGWRLKDPAKQPTISNTEPI